MEDYVVKDKELRRKMLKLQASIIRMDGRLERTCEHGVGHPVGSIGKWEDWMGIHGCCGCCQKWE